MRSDTIIDSNLSIEHDLNHSLIKNSMYFANPINRAHIANQFFLYDKIVIPTKDFGILPILIYWFGLKNFEKVLKSGSIHFLHKPSLLGYAGNGGGITGFTILPSKRPFEWWQEALFGDMFKAIEIQLQYMCPFIDKKHRSKLITTIQAFSRPLQYDNDFFMKYIANESYADVKFNSELLSSIVSLSGNPSRIDLTRVPGVGPSGLKVSGTYELLTPIDIILRVAEINLTLIMGNYFDRADVFIPQGSEKILKNKLSRAKVTPAVLGNFLSLLELENIPDLGIAFSSGELSFNEIWRIRQSRISRKFRNWLRTADYGNERDLEKMYVSSLGRKSFYEKLPSRIIRFAITTASGFFLPPAGVGLEVADNFFVEKWMSGYSPKLFFDQFRKI